MLGWNRRGRRSPTSSSRFVLPGSTLTIVADAPEFEADVAEITGAFANLAT